MTVQSSSPIDHTRTIAHILPWPAVGGTEHATLRIARAIDSTRFRNIAFCVPGAKAVTALFEREGFACARYEPATPSYRQAFQYIRESMALSREFARRHVDLVHCSDLLAGHHAALAGWFARVPVVCHIRNRFTELSHRDCSFLWPIRKFVFVSQNTWQHFGCEVAANRGVVVYDGIEQSLEADRAANRRSVCEEFGIPADAPLVGTMARVAPQKDFPTFVRAAARVLEVEPRARFLIAGDHTSAETYRDHYQLLRQLLAEQGLTHAFTFTGYREDVSRLLSALDVFVLSTHWEGLPLVILEAMAHARPVVATAVDGVPEVVRDGATGLLVAHEDAGQLSDRIIELLEDRDYAGRLGMAGRQLIETEFSVPQFAAGITAVYDELLADPGALRYRVSAAPAR